MSFTLVYGEDFQVGKSAKSLGQAIFILLIGNQIRLKQAQAQFQDLFTGFEELEQVGQRELDIVDGHLLQIVHQAYGLV